MHVAGLAAVEALFATSPDRIERLFFEPHMKGHTGQMCLELAQAHKPYRVVGPDELEKVAGTAMHGGIVALAHPREVLVFDTMEAEDWAKAGQPLLVLDGIGNPHNLGAIARSAAFFGVKAVLIGEGAGNALPSDAAFRVAEGGMEYLDFYRTRDLPRALTMMDPHYRTVASSLGTDAMSLADLPRDRAVALVLGNEENGVSAPVLAACRRQVRIVGHGHGQSLNVAQAGAVFLAALA